MKGKAVLSSSGNSLSSFGTLDQGARDKDQKVQALRHKESILGPGFPQGGPPPFLATSAQKDGELPSPTLSHGVNRAE